MSVISGLGRKNGVGAAVALALLGGTSHAVAQQTERGFTGVEEIVVTARKREETIQNTPVSMTAFSGEGIEARNIDSFSDLSNFAPNLDISGGIPNGGGSATQIFIRGVGQDDYSFPNEPGVGLYIDGVYISRSAAGDFGFLDIERIEVLRGPQGTLYGRNTIGGAVKVITAAPTGELEGRLGATVGSYNRRDIFGHLDFPISDTVSGKIGGAVRKRDGLGTNFIGQDLGNTDELTTRGALRFQPSDDLDIIFRADYLRQRQDGPAGSMVRFDPNDATEGLINALIAPARAAELGLQPPFDRYGDAWVRTLAADGRGVYNSGGTVETRDWADIWGISMSVDWAIGDLALNSITAFRDYDIDIRRDSEHTPFDIVQVDNPETYWQLSQEFQLNGLSMDGRLNWVVGLYGLLEDGKSELFAP
ncbi:MAG: TonB-dependent receptor plug domain-containing protein, partial [Gammaproteobacteria bacterium]|nr:TonB-dependent receptor plug domain-containing protein [Gammaproteobacteria bacterium]